LSFFPSSLFSSATDPSCVRVRTCKQAHLFKTRRNHNTEGKGNKIKVPCFPLVLSDSSYRIQAEESSYWKNGN
jgi:hypothetical protein